MRKPRSQYLYAVAAVAAIAGAAVAIPAWADSGGGGSDPGKTRNLVPAPPPGAGFGFMVAPGAPSGANARQAREKLNKVTTCLKKHGADIPGVHVWHNGASIQGPPLKARAAMKRISKKCGMPPPPARGQLIPPPLISKQMQKHGKAMRGFSTCMRSKGRALPMPPPLPRRK